MLGCGNLDDKLQSLYELHLLGRWQTIHLAELGQHMRTHGAPKLVIFLDDELPHLREKEGWDGLPLRKYAKDSLAPCLPLESCCLR